MQGSEDALCVESIVALAQIASGTSGLVDPGLRQRVEQMLARRLSNASDVVRVP